MAAKAIGCAETIGVSAIQKRTRNRESASRLCAAAKAYLIAMSMTWLRRIVGNVTISSYDEENSIPATTSAKPSVIGYYSQLF